jgi:anti-sigma regulatory factor (Ser/Thr protein kinase)/RimJ/RimL family protein N-acetyltransferase
MDQELRLRNHASVIDPATDFAYKWGLNVGLSDEKARRLALAVDEIVTDVVKFAYPGEEETFQVAFRHDLTTAEVIIREQGVPFDPAEIAYDRDRAVDAGDFDGAGYEVVKRCVDEIQFLNKGSEGKEFRLVQHVEARHIVDLEPAEVVQDTEVPDDDLSYDLVDVTPADARDIAKLIYRTYGDTYSKEELYYPDTIEQALRNDEKFGVIVRTEYGAAVGYFAVLRSDDSDVGEVGEAVVDVNHRRRGLMTRMLEALIERAEEEGLLGVFGEAVTAHEISQRANARFDFVSSALCLAYQPTERFTGLIDDYPQPISNLIDFKPLVPYDTVTPHLPEPYAETLRTVYDELGAVVVKPDDRPGPLPAEAVLDARIEYGFQHAILVVEEPGADVVEQVEQTIADLNGTDLNAMYVDLPLRSPHTPALTERLREAGFFFAGLMPRFHRELDHLRLQRPMVALDPDAIVVYSDLAHRLKERVVAELEQNQMALA